MLCNLLLASILFATLFSFTLADSLVGKTCYDDGYIDGRWRAWGCWRNTSGCRNLKAERQNKDRAYGSSINSACARWKNSGNREARNAYQQGWNRGYK